MRARERGRGAERDSEERGGLVEEGRLRRRQLPHGGGRGGVGGPEAEEGPPAQQPHHHQARPPPPQRLRQQPGAPAEVLWLYRIYNIYKYILYIGRGPLPRCRLWLVCIVMNHVRISIYDIFLLSHATRPAGRRRSACGSSRGVLRHCIVFYDMI